MTKPDKYLMYTADSLTAFATHKSDVVMEVKMPEAGLMPGVTVAFRMLPDEARQVAQLLTQMADEAENSQN